MQCEKDVSLLFLLFFSSSSFFPPLLSPFLPTVFFLRVHYALDARLEISKFCGESLRNLGSLHIAQKSSESLEHS